MQAFSASTPKLTSKDSTLVKNRYKCATTAGLPGANDLQKSRPSSGYSFNISAPVCGTGSSGSIPGSRQIKAIFNNVF